MIRKAIIVVLTLAAVGTVALNSHSYSNTITRQLRLTNNDVLFFHFSNGFSRLLWLRCEEEFEIEVEPGVSDLEILVPSNSNACKYFQLRIASPDEMREIRMPTHQVVWRNRRKTYARCPPLNAPFVRTRTWTVSTIFAVYPMLAFIRGPLRR